MRAAIASLRYAGAARIIVALPVGAASAGEKIRKEADEVVCLYAPAEFYAVGQFFEDFSEVTDDMVVTAMSRAARAA